jgi:uncharacterized protein
MMIKPPYILFLFTFVLWVNSGLSGQEQIDPDGYNTFYYPNGQISSEGYMRDGQPDGYWKTYYDNGVLKSEGNREDFLLDSTWKFYDESGKLLLLINYEKGMKEGKRITYRETETIEENFENDVKQGLTTYFYPDGSVFKTINFKDGLEDGMAKEYAEDGRVVMITRYRSGFLISRERINRLDAQDRKQGNWKFFYDNGLVKLEGRYFNDQRNGYFKEYDRDGKLLSASKWVDGEKQEDVDELAKLEVVRDYYPDGKVSVFQTFKNGVPHGVRREYSEDGKIIAGFIFDEGKKVAEGITGRDGVRNGPWKDFYPGGQIKAEGIYEEGVRTGKWTFYHLNGNVEQVGEYDGQGRPVGRWEWYYPSGNLLREEQYIKGQADGMMTEYREDGSIIAEGDFIDDEEEGPWVYDLGNYREEGGFSFGRRHGVWKHYFGDGTLKFEGEFIDGRPHGKHLYYWDNGNIKDEITYQRGMRQGEAKSFNYDGTLLITITYNDGVETRYDGIKIDPVVVQDQDVD